MSRLDKSGVSERAARVDSLQRELDAAYAARDGSDTADARWARAAEDFDAAFRAFYEPYESVLAGVREGRTEDVEEATRFLVADPWCFRSGYLKADLMHALANVTLPHHVVPPLQQVVLRRVTDRQPRLLRYAAQLASNVWDDGLERAVRQAGAHGTDEDRVAAAALIAGAEQRRRSLEGERERP